MFVRPGFGQHDARGALGHVGRGADGDAHFGLAEGGRIVDAIARHAGDVPCGLQVLHDDVLVLRIHLRETIGTRQQVHRLIARLRIRRLQVRHAPNVGQANALPDLMGDGQRIAREHLHRNTQFAEFGDELLGIGPRRIVQRHQSEQGGGAGFGAARHRQRSISLQCGLADTGLQRLDRRGLESAGFGNGSHGTFHHAQPLAVLFDHRFRPPVLRIKR
jgi:hypothetical protein